MDETNSRAKERICLSFQRSVGAANRPERANSDRGSGCHAVAIAITYQRQGCEELLIFGHRTHPTFNTSRYLDRAFGRVLLREERGLCGQ